jgi:hypothetical protein
MSSVSEIQKIINKQLHRFNFVNNSDLEFPLKFELSEKEPSHSNFIFFESIKEVKNAIKNFKSNTIFENTVQFESGVYLSVWVIFPSK